MNERPEKRAGFPGQRILVLSRRVLRGMMERRPALRGLTIAAAGYYPKATGHLRRRPKGTEQVIFIYCVKGAGWCEMAARRQAVQEGDLLVVPPGAPHAYGAADERPWTIHWFHAMGALVPEYLRNLGITPEKPVVWLGEDLRLISLFEEVQEVIEHDYAYVDLLHASHTLAHLVSLMVRLRQERGRGALDAEQKVTQCVVYMKQHLDQPLSVRALSALANLSPSRFTELFREQTGDSPHQYLQRLRVHQACQLLDSTNLSLKQIAAGLGYQDQFHFSRVFKAIQEMPPSDYRARSLGLVKPPRKRRHLATPPKS
jgi:AraC-like DNA-binding protein/mannose-6-phosphate isomerase-like protein (cupin superfamily)